MGQELCHIKLPLVVQSCLGDLPASGTESASPPALCTCLWAGTIFRFFLTAWLSWPVHTRSRVTLSGSYSCRQSCHLLEENPLCLVMMGILLPALPHLFITLTYRSWVFVCLLQNCASVVSGEHECLIAFLGVGQLFPDVHDQAIASHFCRLFPVYLCLLCLQYVSLDCNGAIGKTGCRV